MAPRFLLPLIALTAACALTLSGCNAQFTPISAPPSSTGSTAPHDSTPAENAPSPAPAPDAGGTHGISPSPTNGDFAISAISDLTDYLLIAEAPGATGELQLTRFANDMDRGPLHGLYRTLVARGSSGFCEWQTEEGRWMYAHIGTTPDGSPVDESALDVLTGGDGSFEHLAEAPYEHETYGAGTIHFAEIQCIDEQCAVCHYVEGAVMVSLVRPVDGQCRSVLRGIVDVLRN